MPVGSRVNGLSSRFTLLRTNPFIEGTSSWSEAEDARAAAAGGVIQAEGRLTQSTPVAAQIQAARASADLALPKVTTAETVVQAAQLALSYTKILAPSAHRRM